MYFDIIKFDPVNNYILFTKEQLKTLKKEINPVQLENYIKDMDVMFTKPLETVMSKKHSPVSNLHDYVSFATYYWKNEETKDGFPYVLKDGYSNPIGLEYDKDKLRRLANLVYHGAILKYLTNDKKYSDIIEKHMHHFFINEATKMNPNLNHGQYIPGVNLGRAQGVIDYTANFTYALNMVKQLNELNLIDETLVNELKQWHEEFLNWLLTSEIGIAEGKTINNHGTFYDLGVVVVADFVGNKSVVEQFKNKFVETRLDVQIDEEHKLPMELARTKSLSYTLMGLKGLVELSQKFDHLGQDQINPAITWLEKYLYEGKTWPYLQVTEYDQGINSLYLYFINSYKGKNEKLVNNVDFSKVINKTLYYLFEK